MKIWTKVCGLICFVFPWRADSSLAQRGQWVLLKGFQCVLAGHPCYSEKREAFGPHWAFTDAFPRIRTSHYFSAFFHIFFSSWRKKKKMKNETSFILGPVAYYPDLLCFPWRGFQICLWLWPGCHRMVSVPAGCGMRAGALGRFCSEPQFCAGEEAERWHSF